MVKRYHISSVSDITDDRPREVVMYGRELRCTQGWNPIHFAIYFGKTSLVAKLLDNCKLSSESIILATRDPSRNDFRGDMFALELAISGQNFYMFKYFWK